MGNFELAQVNISRMKAPLDDESSRAFERDARGTSGILVDMSVWTSVEALADFVFSGEHLAILKRRSR